MAHLRIVVPAFVTALVLAACGSQLDPDTVGRVNGADMYGQAGGSNGGHGDGPAEGADGSVTEDSAGAAGAGEAAGPAGSDGTTGTGSAAGGTEPGSGGAGDGGNEDAGGGAPAAGSCKGFQNQTGITDDKVVIANVSDLSGPMPGLFESAQQATRAFVKYFNSENEICGRKLEIINFDSQADAGANQRAYAEACEKAFAAVGSTSAYDAGGADTTQSCGLPDIRAGVFAPERQACSTCFGAYAIKTNMVPDAYAKWFMKKHPKATKNVGMLYINIGAAPPNAKNQSAAWEKMGWDVKYLQGIDPSEFNFAPYVQQLKDKGIELVVYMGPYQNTVKLQEAMQQQNYEPEVFLQDPTIYDQRYTDQAGSLAEDVYVYSTNDLFSNTSNREMALYLGWLQQVKPGAIPNYFGLYAWSAARLFTEKALALGGDLTRKAMVGEVKKTTQWTANGLHTAQNVGKGMTPPCAMVIQYTGEKWQKVSPGNYMCGGLVDSGMGG